MVEPARSGESAGTDTGQPGNGRSPEFIESIARGLEVIRALGGGPRSLSLSEVAAAAGLTRPTTRRILITLSDLGYVRSDGRSFQLTPRVLDLGLAHIAASGIWEASRARLAELSSETRESCSIAQLDGSDIVYVARAAAPKLVTLTVTIGTRFPATHTSLGKVLLAALAPDELDATLAIPSRSPVTPPSGVDRDDLLRELRQVRAQGWALTDQLLGPAIRSVATGIRDGGGHVVAAANVNAHAAETSIEKLEREYLPALLRAASDISADYARMERIPSLIVE